MFLNSNKLKIIISRYFFKVCDLNKIILLQIEQIFTGCLSHAAYYIQSTRVVSIFDSLREFQSNINRAKRDNTKIKYVFETNFHADFVSGHLDLSQKTPVIIICEPTEKPYFQALFAEDD
jgi:hydroxyacylglutathione hydrolase